MKQTKKIVINEKTHHGTSTDYALTQRVMQGDTWSSAMASGQVDAIGKEMTQEEPSYIFKYKGEGSTCPNSGHGG